MKHAWAARGAGASVVVMTALLLLNRGAVAEGQGPALPLTGHWQVLSYLGCVSFGFWAVVLVRPDQWWAVFPATVSATAVVAVLIGPVNPQHVGGVFFLSLANAFVLCYLLGRPRAQVRWTIYPAAVSAVLGSLLLIDHGVVRILGSVAVTWAV